MSHPLIYRNQAIVLTVNGRVRYHIGSPFSEGYDSMTAVRLAIDERIDGKPAMSQLEARSAYFAAHVTAAAYITLIAKMRLSECL